MPAGLNLYIMTSSLFGTIEQKRIRAHIKEQEDAVTLLKPTEKPIGSGGGDKPRKPSFMEKMQKAVDEAQKKQAQRPQKSKTKPKLKRKP